MSGYQVPKNVIRAHIFGRRKRGDREEVKMSLYNEDGTDFVPGGLPTLYLAGKDFPVPSGSVMTGNEVGIRAIQNLCSLYGELDILTPTTKLNLSLTGQQLSGVSEVSRAIVLLEPKATGAYVLDASDDFSTDHVNDSDWWYWNDPVNTPKPVIENGRLKAPLGGIFQKASQQREARVTAKFQMPGGVPDGYKYAYLGLRARLDGNVNGGGEGMVGVLGAYKFLQSPKSRLNTAFDFRVWGGITEFPATSSGASTALATDTDYWFRLSIDRADLVTFEIFASDPAIGSPASVTKITATLEAGDQKNENARPGKPWLQSSYLVDDVKYERWVPDYTTSLGIVTVSNTDPAVISVRRADNAPMIAGTRIQFGQLQYFKK